MAVLRIVEPRPQDITNTIFRLPPFHYRNKGTFRCARGGNTADTPWKMLNNAAFLLKGLTSLLPFVTFIFRLDRSLFARIRYLMHDSARFF